MSRTSKKVSDRHSHKQSNQGARTELKQVKTGLSDILQENQLYEDVIDQINRKLALRQAMDKGDYGYDNASKAASAVSHKTPSSFGVDSRGKFASQHHTQQHFSFISESAKQAAGRPEQQVLLCLQGIVGFEGQQQNAIYRARPN